MMFVSPQFLYKEYLSVDSQINSSMSSATYDSNPLKQKNKRQMILMSGL